MSTEKEEDAVTVAQRRLLAAVDVLLTRTSTVIAAGAMIAKEIEVLTEAKNQVDRLAIILRLEFVRQGRVSLPKAEDVFPEPEGEPVTVRCAECRKPLSTKAKHAKSPITGYLLCKDCFKREKK